MIRTLLSSLEWVGRLLHLIPREGGNGHKALTAEELEAAQRIIDLQTQEVAAMGTRIQAQLGQIEILTKENERLRLERNAKGHALMNAQQKVISLIYVIETFGPPEMQAWIPKIDAAPEQRDA